MEMSKRLVGCHFSWDSTSPIAEKAITMLWREGSGYFSNTATGLGLAFRTLEKYVKNGISLDTVHS